MFLNQLIDDRRQVSGHRLGKPVQGEIDAVIGDATIGEIVGAYLLRAITAANEITPSLRLLVDLFLLCLVHQFRLQQAHGPGAVLVLGPFVLAFHDDACRQVRQPHRGIRFVHVLPVSTRRSFLSISIWSTSSISGITATVHAEV